MTPEPIVLAPGATIAEALAHVRNPDITPALASMVFVVPAAVGHAHRPLPGLRARPAAAARGAVELVAGVLDSELDPARARGVAGRGHPLLRRRTTSSAGPSSTRREHLLGAVTVDDVLDHLLPDDWRSQPDPEPARAGSAAMPEPTHPPAARPARRHPPPAGSASTPEWFARVAERLARFLGTGTFLLWQTVLVIIWITLNVFAIGLQWDPYPFILLNLAFSTQAAYAAPLILLAQNRQDDRDRVSLEEDRARAGAANAETEYLARELASMRLPLGEVVTRDYLRGELEQLFDAARRSGAGQSTSDG